MSRYRWTILALGTIAQASYSAVFLGIPVLAPQLRDEYGLSLTQIGVVLAAFSIGSVVTLLPWGLLADRVGERGVLASGLAVASVALVFAAFASGYVALVLLLAVAGGAGASVNAASGRAVMGWFAAVPARARARDPADGPAARRRRRGGRASAHRRGGGTEAGLLVLAAACLATAVAGAVGLREAPPDDDQPLGDVIDPLRDPRIWRLATGSGLIVVAQISIMAFTVLFLHGVRGLSTAAAAGVFARDAAGRGGAQDRRRPLVGPGGGADRASPQARSRPLARARRQRGVDLGAARPLRPGVPRGGALSLSWNGLAFTATAELAGRSRAGAALGFQQTALAVASGLAPPLFALLVESTSWGVAFGLAAALPLAGAGLMRRIPA